MTESQLPTAPARPAAWPYWAPPAAWLAVMLFFSSLPDPGRVLGPAMNLGDTVLHSSGNFVLMLLVCRLALFRAGRFGLRPVLLAFLFCAAYGLLDEVHQIPIPGRSFEWRDWGSDMGGAAIGGVVVLVVGGIGRALARDRRGV